MVWHLYSVDQLLKIYLVDEERRDDFKLEKGAAKSRYQYSVIKTIKIQ